MGGRRGWDQAGPRTHIDAVRAPPSRLGAEALLYGLALDSGCGGE